MEKKSKINISVLVLVIMLLVLFIAWLFRGSILDDAFISFRYADNLINGHGLVFNIGEKVEGYTNFLWIILLSFFMKLGFDVTVIAQLFGLVFNLSTLYLTYILSRKISGKNNIFNIIAIAFMAVNLSFTMWSMHGMETAFFTFMILLSMYSYLNESDDKPNLPITSLLFALASMVRPEGIIFYTVTAIHRVISTRGKRKQWLIDNIKWSSAFIVIYTVYFIWRYSYYGFIFPNTFYTKVGSGYNQYIRGLGYLFNFFIKTGGVLLVLPALMLFKNTRKKWTVYLFLLEFVYVLYIIYVGGDAFLGFRFFIPLYPIIYISLQEGTRYLYDYLLANKSKYFAYSVTVMLVIVLAGTFAGVISETKEEYKEQKVFNNNMIFAGKWLKRNALDDESVALNPVGAVGYYSKLHIVDMLGLTDKYIAHSDLPDDFGKGVPGHERGNGKYILSKRPKYILLRNVWFGPVPIENSGRLMYKSEKEIWNEPEFHKYYDPVNVKITEGYFGFYQRKAVDDRSIEAILKYIDNYPDSVDGYLRLGYIYYELKQFADALSAYLKALQIKPDEYKVYATLIGLYAQQGKYDKAIESFNRGIKMSPNYPDLYRNIGLVYKMLGDYEKRTYYWEKYLKINPTAPEAHILRKEISNNK